MNCTVDEPCSEWQGQCNDLKNHLDCQIGLLCGEHNCHSKENDTWKLSNCCFKAQGTNIILQSLDSLYSH